MMCEARPLVPVDVEEPPELSTAEPALPRAPLWKRLALATLLAALCCAGAAAWHTRPRTPDHGSAVAAAAISTFSAGDVDVDSAGGAAGHVTTMVKAIGSGKSFKDPDVQQHAAKALKGASMTCMGIAAAATGATAGIAAPLLAPCAAGAVGGSIMAAYVEEEGPSNQDVLDSLRAGFEELGDQLDGLRGDIADFQDQYLEHQKLITANDIQTVSNAYNNGVVHEHLSMLESFDFNRFEALFNGDDFGQIMKDSFNIHDDGGLTWLDIMHHVVTPFVLARAQTFAMHTMWCSLRSTSRPGPRCRAGELNELADKFAKDMESFNKTLAGYQACTFDFGHASIARLPPGCFEQSAQRDHSTLRGNLRDLPRGATFLNFHWNWHLEGHLADLPRSATHIDFHRNRGIGGQLADLPRSATHIDFHRNSHIGGQLADLPRSATYIDLHENIRKIEGQLADLPRSATHIDFHRSRKIQGQLADLPRSATHIDFAWSRKTEGQLADLPRSATHIDFHSSFKQIEGQLADLPRSATYIDLDLSTNIEGQLADLPRSATHLDLGLGHKIEGQLADLPRAATFVELADSNKRITGQRSDLKHARHYRGPETGGGWWR